MFKIKSILVVLACVITLGFSSCDSTLTKEMVIEEFKTQGYDSQLEPIYGENTDAVIECMAEEIVKKYKTESELNEAAEEDLTKIGEDCGMANLPE